jgi:hypothetical protein
MHKQYCQKFVLLAQHYHSGQIQQNESAGYVEPCKMRNAQNTVAVSPTEETQSPRGLKRVLTSTTRILGSRVRIPLGAQVYFLFLLPYVGRGLMTGRPSQGILPNVYKQNSEPRKREILHRIGLLCHTRTNLPLSATPNILCKLTVVILLHITKNAMIFLRAWTQEGKLNIIPIKPRRPIGHKFIPRPSYLENSYTFTKTRNQCPATCLN